MTRDISEKAVALRQNAAKRARITRDGLADIDSNIASIRESLRSLPTSDEAARRVLNGYVHIKQIQRGNDELVAQLYERLARGEVIP